MTKRTKRRNVRYSRKRNSRKKRVSKKRRVSRKVSKKTYKRKNMRGGVLDSLILEILEKQKFKEYKNTYIELEESNQDIIKQYLDSSIDDHSKLNLLITNLKMKFGHAIQFLDLYNKSKGVSPPGAQAANAESLAGPARAAARPPEPYDEDAALAAAIAESLAGPAPAPARAAARPPEPYDGDAALAAAIAESLAGPADPPEPDTGGSAGPPVMKEGSKTIYEILKDINLLKYYDAIVEKGYDDTIIMNEGFIDDLIDDLMGLLKGIVLPEKWKIKVAFKKYIAQQQQLQQQQLQQQQLQQQQLQQQLQQQQLQQQQHQQQQICVNCRAFPALPGHPYCSRTCASAAGAAKASVGIPGGFGAATPLATVAPAAAALPAAGGFGAGVDSYIGYPGKNMCINCLKNPKINSYQFCGKWCAGKLKEKKESYPIAGGTKCGDFSDNPANYPHQDSRILNGQSPVPINGQPDYDIERYIYFYERDKNYKEFSNFYPCPSLVINGFKFPTSEHYFQCAKFKGPKFSECTGTFGEGARAVFDFAKHNKGSVIDGWHGKSSFTGIFYPWCPDYKPNLKDLEMYKGVYHKFTQDEYLKHLLLCTGDKIIVEHAYPDPYWGDRNYQISKTIWNLGNPGNHLGQILMLVRMDINRDNQHLPDVIARQAILTM